MSFLLGVALAAPLLVSGSTNSTKQVGSLSTRWTASVTAENAHREYPRPQLVRGAWLNLNGPWDFAISRKAEGEPTPGSYTRKILVPFPVESRLSGIQQPIQPDEIAWYRRTFRRPVERGWVGQRVLLHFGASNWDTRVWVNGKLVGWHQGGYDGFTFDITADIKGLGDQTIVAAVSDPTDLGPQPRGKQSLKPGGIFYTASTGIWQPVWLEPVPERHIDSLRISTSAKTGDIHIRPIVRGSVAGMRVRAEVIDAGRIVARGRHAANGAINLHVPRAKLWSPDSPNLYDLKVTLEDSKGKAVDTVNSYAGIRDVVVERDSSGVPRVLLNGNPIFMAGPLDQGFWPDGLYTAPTDDAIRFDIETTKRLGFNMIRKHVKVEPQRWYWWADKLGVLVLQDMPSGDKFIGPNDPDVIRSPESRRIYETELRAMIDGLRDHPCIVCWVPFNEGWGQFDTAGITKLIRSYDPTRLVDSTTGWADRGVGDFNDVHSYPGPAAPKPDPGRASILGEFGGLGLAIPGHTWKGEGWGYQTYNSRDELTTSIVALFRNLRLLEDSEGLVGAVYTQTSDVETELNGLMTYDRSLLKPDVVKVREAVRALYGPGPAVEQVLPASDRVTVNWDYTEDPPPSDWAAPEFNPLGWKVGPGGFGTVNTPGAVIGTRWSSSDIWLRRAFEIPHNFDPHGLYLRIHHDDDAEVFLDGKRVMNLPKWTTGYTLVPMPSWSESDMTPGRHVLAIHCHQVSGGQYIDAGIVRLVTRA